MIEPNLPIITIDISVTMPKPESAASFQERWLVGFESFEEATGGNYVDWFSLPWDRRSAWMPERR